MSTITVNYSKFDVIEYIKKLRNVGVSQEIAEVQGQELEHIIVDILHQTKHNTKDILNNNELVTKTDILILKESLNDNITSVENRITSVESNLRETELRLQKEIAQTSNKTIIWIGGLLFASGLIQHFFK